MRRGDIWWAKLPGPWGRRPVLLIARNEAYQLLTWVVAVPLATRLRDAPSMVVARRLRARGVSQEDARG